MAQSTNEQTIEMEDLVKKEREEVPMKKKKKKCFTESNIFKWLIVLGSFVVYFICDGVSMTFGIFTREFIDYFGESNSKTFLTTGLIQSIPLFMSPFVCLLIDKYHCRPVALVGATLLVASFVSTRYLVSSLLTLNLTIGIMTSLGLAMLYIPAYLIISFNFSQKRAFATGIAVSGSGLGVMVLSPLAEYLIREYDWMDACLLFGAISSHTFISACLFRKPEENNNNKEQQQNETQVDTKEVHQKKREHKMLSRVLPNQALKLVDDLIDIYKNKRFILVNLSYFMLSASIATPHNFLPSHIKLEENLDDPSSIAISLLGISNLIGQIVIGFICDAFRKQNWLIYVICILIAGVSTCLLPFMVSLPLVYGYSLVFGLTSSVNYVIQSTLVIESLGMANLTLAFGCLQLMQGISTLVVTPLLGLAKDNSNDYKQTFFSSGAILIAASLLLLPWPYFEHTSNKNKTSRTKKEQNSSENLSES